MEPTTRIYQFNLGSEIAKLRLQSQAGTVLVSAAALDGSLRNVLLMVMNLSNNKAEQMFGTALGPLYHFSPKIEIAYAFKVIGEDLYNDLRIIKDIRNKFAHPEGPTDFETPKVKELVRKFKSWTSSSDSYALFIQRVEHCQSELNAVADRQLMVQALAPEPK
jgi:DNA-binding MltR family transcriptional regulator